MEVARRSGGGLLREYGKVHLAALRAQTAGSYHSRSKGILVGGLSGRSSLALVVRRVVLSFRAVVMSLQWSGWWQTSGAKSYTSGYHLQLSGSVGAGGGGGTVCGCSGSQGS